MQQDGGGWPQPGLRTRSGRRTRGVPQAARILLACVASGAFAGAGISQAGQTERIGGRGERPVRMDCGADAFMTGLDAAGGASNPLDTRLVRVLWFECAAFSTMGVSGNTTAVRASSGYLDGPSHGLARCGAREVIQTVHLFAGSYIDRIEAVSCVGEDGRLRTPVAVNAGGGGGSPYALQCPAGEALYRVDATAGMAIDSLQGFCRPFPLRPSFDEAPAEGALLPVSVTNDASIRLRAHSATGPLTLSYAVPSTWASRFELALPPPPPGALTAPTIGTRTPVTPTLPGGGAAPSITRVLRIKGPVPVIPVAARIVPVTLTVRDGVGRTSTRSFRVQLVP